MNSCICCHGRLLRHLKHSRTYWFCPNCYQKMPNIDELVGSYRHNRATITCSNIALLLGNNAT